MMCSLLASRSSLGVQEGQAALDALVAVLAAHLVQDGLQVVLFSPGLFLWEERELFVGGHQAQGPDGQTPHRLTAAPTEQSSNIISLMDALTTAAEETGGGKPKKRVRKKADDKPESPAV